MVKFAALRLKSENLLVASTNKVDRFTVWIVVTLAVTVIGFLAMSR